MGKRDRRRKRQRAAAQAKRKAVPRVLYPSADQPLLEVVFEPDVSDEDKAVCLDYWSFTEPGAWTHKVAEIGPTTQVVRTVKASCHAELLTVVCPDCAGPRSAFSRSDVTATRLWAPDVFPRQETVSVGQCQACRDASAAEAAREAERAEQEKRERTRQQVEAAGVWLQEQADREFPDEIPDLVHALTLLTLVEIMKRKDSESVGPLQDLNYTVTASDGSDIDVFRTLHQQRWICPTTPATLENFVVDDEGTVRGVYITQIPWRLAPSLGGKTSARREAADLMTRAIRRQVDDLKQQVHRLEAGMAVHYLEGLLTRKYNEEPIPEHRLPDAYETFLNALKAGFTLGQLVAIAWSSAAGSVAWGQRTPGLKPGSVSSASVTNLERRIGYAQDRRIDEYDLPNWVPRPAIYATALRLLQQHDSEAEALNRFQTCRQRAESRPLEAAEFDGDMADGSQNDDWQLSGQDFMDRLREGAPEEERGPAITYALIEPGGELQFHTDPASRMRDKVSLAGSGFVDRIFLPEPSTVHAYVAEMVTASAEAANPIADEILRLLDCFDGPFYGPISFFSVGQPKSKPRSLSDDQQEMLRAAYEVARSRTAVD